jgi:cytochrome c5
MERQSSMKQYFLCTMAAVAMISAPLHAAPRQQRPAVNSSAQTNTKEASSKKEPTHPEGGERIFQQQCSRCHAAPESFSPRISGTIVRHMRVRASLSQKDEQELLRFLNP